MKATELQLGNIVAVYPSMMPITIAAIHKGKVGYHSVPNKLEWVRIGLIRPIPLTTEILEKNGFHNDTDNVLRQWIEDLRFAIEINALGVYVSVRHKCNVNPTLNIVISYVHELQHVFRFVELNDLADNFKI